MKSPVEVIATVGTLGGRLEPHGDKLRARLPTNCLAEFTEAIRQHKAALVKLLQMRFLLVRSDALKATLFWTPDEATKETLIVAGADPGCIYTASELEQFVRHHVTIDELILIHAAKSRLGGRVVGS